MLCQTGRPPNSTRENLWDSTTSASSSRPWRGAARDKCVFRIGTPVLSSSTSFADHDHRFTKPRHGEDHYHLRGRQPGPTRRPGRNIPDARRRGRLHRRHHRLMWRQPHVRNMSRLCRKCRKTAAGDVRSRGHDARWHCGSPARRQPPELPVGHLGRGRRHGREAAGAPIMTKAVPRFVIVGLAMWVSNWRPLSGRANSMERLFS